MKYCLAALLLIISLQASAKKALIFGVSGQDGYYLTELLLSKGYEIHGVTRNPESRAAQELYQINPALKSMLKLYQGDLTESDKVENLITRIVPDEIYNLGAQSSVAESYEHPEQTLLANALGPLNIYQILSKNNLKHIRVCHASTSEIFGTPPHNPQTEETPFYPNSPYGASKLYAHMIGVIYRRSYNLFICNAILYNHESPRRPAKFVSQKIARAAAEYAKGSKEILYLGNLDGVRDWGYAPDFVEGMWRMLQHEAPDDYILATGEHHTVREFVSVAYKKAETTLHWVGTGIEEKGIDTQTNTLAVAVDPKFFRANEPASLLGNASKAHQSLGWKPYVVFNELVALLVKSILETQQL